MTKKQLTGYPSIDKPWEKYYREDAINAELPQCKYVDYLFESNKDRLNEAALEYMGAKITFKEMRKSVLAAAKGLAALGIRVGDTVAVFSVNTPETLYCVFALNLLGAVPCVEYVTEAEKEATEAALNCSSGFVIVLDVLIEKFACLAKLDKVQHILSLPLARSMPALKRAAVKLKVKQQHCEKEISFEEMLKAGEKLPHVESEYRKNAPAVILHSGGTTGVPKGVVLTNENIIYVSWGFYVGGNDGKPGDYFYTCIPIFHAFGFISGIIMPLINKCCLSLAVKFDERSFIENFIRLKPAHTMSSSTYLPTLIHDPAIKNMDLSFYKTMGMGGTPISNATELELGEFMKNHNSMAKPSIGYGMSELASAACTELNRYYGKVGSVGIPLCKVNIKVCSTETGEELKVGQEGELHISSPGLMLEYFNNPEETKAVIVADESGTRWIKSGDLGYVDEDGFVFITGKLKRIYTTRSDKNSPIFHIFPDYIANRICEVSWVRECAVVCLPHPDLKSFPVAFVVPVSEADTASLPETVMKHCKNDLPGHSVPHAVHVIDSLPKNAVGKPDYKLLEKMAEASIESKDTK